ncbi:testis-specific zinc finger protein topi [Euwallacea fornicatus]|uniref:testis-specific zinc finger protein topi n=1 Tax=Euwallacea fornicatus TaxID=995702 RepID=UPI00338F66E2
MNSLAGIVIYKIVDNKIASISGEARNINSLDQNFIENQKAVEKELRLQYICENYNEDKLCLNYSHLTTYQESIAIEKLHSLEEKPNFNPSTHTSGYRNLVGLNFPTLIKCQNCETNFPTKYQYQRHQCDSSTSKLVYASDQDGTDLQNVESHHIVVEDTHVCLVCSKVFRNKDNLDQHHLTHLNNPNHENACEFCGKKFVTDNRLRIHKENHCKKAGDISKFYRSDVTVWKCKRCHEVFSSAENSSHHIPYCQESSVADVLTERIIQAQRLSRSKNQDNARFINEDDEYFVDDPFPQKQNISDTIEIISTELLLQCEFCNRTFSEKNLLLLHQRKHTTSKNYECTTCGKVFDSYSLADSHWVKTCSQFSNVFYLPKLLYCEYCDKTFKSHEILYNHKIKKKHYTPKLHLGVNIRGMETRFPDQSRQVLENKDVINRLIRDVLMTLEVPMVNSEGGEAASQMIKIESQDCGIVTLSSDDCKKIPLPEDLSKKKITPLLPKKRKEKPIRTRNKKPCTLTDEGFHYQCERCIKVFNCISSLENHRSTEHVATFCCEECGETLGSAKALLIHCREHKSLKPYVCDTCGRSYSQTSHLWQHMRFHQGIKPFACPHQGCEARYTIRPDLKDHIRKVHTRERPFKCNVCSKSFLTGSVFYQHRLIHTNDRRYGCEVCKKRFFRADALNNHKRIHTDERPYPCLVCGREFRQKGDRNKHLRTQHRDQSNINI